MILDIHYKRFFRKRKLSIKVPETWDELSEQQLLAMQKLYMAKINETDFICLFFGLKRRIVRLLAPYQLFKITELLEFAKDKNMYSFRIKYIEEGGKRYYAPGDRLKGMKFGEFCMVDSLFLSYMNNPSDEALNMLIGSLYREKGGLYRIPFDEELMDLYKKNAEPIKEEIKTAIVLNYSIVRLWLIDAYPAIFPKQKEEDKNKKVISFTGNEWINFYDSVVGDDIANEDKYKDKGVHTVLRLTGKQVLRLKKQKQKARK